MVRCLSLVVCGKIACSTDRNGPTSLPEGLIVPSTAAALSRNRLSVMAKTAPAWSKPSEAIAKKQEADREQHRAHEIEKAVRAHPSGQPPEALPMEFIRPPSTARTALVI